MIEYIKKRMKPDISVQFQMQVVNVRVKKIILEIRSGKSSLVENRR